MASADYQARVAELGPVAYWRLDDGLAPTDAVGSLDGYFEGGGAGASGLVEPGGAARFDGVDDRIVIADAAPLHQTDGTAALWFRADALGGVQGLLSRDSSGYDGGGHVSLYLDGAEVVLRIQDTARSHELRAGGITAGEAHHVAFSFGDGG